MLKKIWFSSPSKELILEIDFLWTPQHKQGVEAFVKNKVESSSCYSVVSVTKIYLVLFIVALKISQ